MKSAFVHCRIMPGGALNVLKDLIIEEKSKFVSLEKGRGSKAEERFISPEIHIFTLVSDSKILKIGDTEYQITTALPSRLNRFFIYWASKKTPVFSTLFDYRNLIIFAPFWMEILSRKIRKFKPDHITMSSFAIAKNISLKTKDYGLKTTLYLHSPMQYIRSHYDEYTHKLTGRKGRLFKKITPRLRKRDKKFTQFDEVYANSHYTAKLAKEIYNINAKVKYPKVNISIEPNSTKEILPYYIYTGRLVKFVKEVDKIIELFNHTYDPLIIIGSGPDEAYLKSIAHKNIIFIDRLENSELLKILAQAKGLINLTKESFGISTAEALLLGVPVFGYNQGATPELVDQDSGILVDKKNLHTLIAEFEKFKSRQRDREKIMRSIKDKLSKN